MQFVKVQARAGRAALAVTVGITCWSSVAMRVIPLGDKVVVKRVEAEEKTAGGIVLPDAAKDKPAEGRILSVGDGRALPNGDLASFQVSEGDRVLFSSYAGTEVNIDGEELLIMNESDILAVMA